MSCKRLFGLELLAFLINKKSQKHEVLKSNEKLALFLLLTLGQNNQAFMNFI